MTTSDALAQQLVRLLDARLADPLEILLEGDDSVALVRGRLHRRALHWAFVIEHGPGPEAVQAIARLIATLYPDDHAFAPPVDWWRTPLGQAVARRVGHPFATSVTLAMAGAMLGISRQGVHDLVRRGKLPRHADGGVPVSAVRERLLGGDSGASLDHAPTDPATADRARVDLALPGLRIRAVGDLGHDGPVEPGAATDDHLGNSGPGSATQPHHEEKR